LSKKKRISLAKMSEIGANFGDPISKAIHNWLRRYKIESVKNGRWLFLFLLIFLNNLLLAAFVSRIIYGLIFIIPLLLTAWSGFGHGVLFSKPKGRVSIVLTFFEFGGYLFATVIGVSIGKSILGSIIKGNQIIINIPWKYTIPMILFLFAGAAVETLLLKEASKTVDLSKLDENDFEKYRKIIAKQIDADA
jgi:hypothetical protein